MYINCIVNNVLASIHFSSNSSKMFNQFKFSKLHRLSTGTLPNFLTILNIMWRN